MRNVTIYSKRNVSSSSLLCDTVNGHEIDFLIDWARLDTVQNLESRVCFRCERVTNVNLQ